MRVAITGANSGIGLRAVRRFAESGADVIALSRSRERGELAIATLARDARARVRLVELDLASPVSIAGAAETVVAEGPLDVLINNAAVFDLSAREARFTETGQELFWATNHLGPTEFTARVSGALAAAPSPRVVFVASKGLVTMPGLAIRFDALTDGSWFTPTKAYYHSKLAQVMTAVTLAERVGDLVDVSCLRVPAVRLDADRLAEQPPILRALYAPKNRLAMPAEALADVYVDLGAGAPRHPRGSDVYVDEKRRVVALPRSARDAAQRERLWSVTAEATGNPAWAWEAAGRPTGRSRVD